MSNEYQNIHAFDFNLICEYFSLIERQGPGSKESTLKALGFIDNLSKNSVIADLGCGTGGQTMTLAQHTTGKVTGLDLFPGFIDHFNKNAALLNLQDRVKGIVGSMDKLPFEHQSLDLIWSEGAIYNIGFEQGLKRWRRLLRTGGYVAVSEAVCLTENPPQRAKEFWEAEYPAMTSVEENLSKLSSTGFTPVGHFILPPTDWENYYLPLQAHLAEFQASHTDNAAAESLVKSVQKEIDIWKECGTTFGYAFFVGRAV